MSHEPKVIKVNDPLGPYPIGSLVETQKRTYIIAGPKQPGEQASAYTHYHLSPYDIEVNKDPKTGRIKSIKIDNMAAERGIEYNCDGYFPYTDGKFCALTQYKIVVSGLGIIGGSCHRYNEQISLDKIPMEKAQEAAKTWETMGLACCMAYDYHDRLSNMLRDKVGEFPYPQFCAGYFPQAQVEICKK